MEWIYLFPSVFLLWQVWYPTTYANGWTENINGNQPDFLPW